MKTTYTLTGIDEEGNIILEHELEAQEVITILTNALKNNKENQFIKYDSSVMAPGIVAALSKKYKKKVDGGGSKIIKDPRRGISADVVEDIKKFNRAGKTDAEIMEEAGASKSTVYRILRDAGLKSNKATRDRVQTLPKNTTRHDAMTFAKYGQVKVAFEHQLPANTIAHEMHITVKEVERAERSKNFEEYAAL